MAAFKGNLTCQKAIDDALHNDTDSNEGIATSKTASNFAELAEASFVFPNS